MNKNRRIEEGEKGVGIEQKEKGGVKRQEEARMKETIDERT